MLPGTAELCTQFGPTLTLNDTKQSEQYQSWNLALGRWLVSVLEMRVVSDSAKSQKPIASLFHRQPNPGATYFKTEDNMCTLYSTPSVLGIVNSSVSASWIASSPANSLMS